jgi:ligand-binding sensor domain-containing protein/signal transduction histidine kinase
LRNSNISREGRKQSFSLFKWLLAVHVALCLVNSASALSPNKAISRYLRDEWSAEQGFPGGRVYAIAQTPDGYLWIGTEKGLVRFDGLRFQFFDPSSSPKFPTGPVVGLVVDSEGTLWVRPRGLTLLRYRDGAVQDVLQNLTAPEAYVTAMCLSRNGEILFSRYIQGITRYNKGRLASVAPASELPRLIISLAETGDGVIWMGTREEGLHYLSGGRVSALTQSLPDRKINVLLPISEHELWIGTDTGVARWDGKEISQIGASRSLEHISAFAMIRDRDSNIWVGTSRGLQRIDARGGFSAEQGDNARSVSALFEDREGNLWVGTERGIERLRDTVFTTYSASNGLPFESNGPLFVDLEGRTWFAPTQGGLYWLKDGRLGRVADAQLQQDVIYSIDGRKDELWVGRRRGLTRLRNDGSAFKAETYTQAQGLAENSVYVVHENRDGTVWAGTLSAGLSSFWTGNFKTYTANILASNSITSIAEGSDGTTWVGTPNGLNALSNGQWRTYTSSDGLPSANVNCLMVDSNGTLWIGTAAGLAFLHSGTIENVNGVAESLREPILGIEEDKTGSLWIATENRIVRLDRSNMSHQKLTESDLREYGVADGLLSTQVVQRQRSVVADSLGRIWFSTSRGISFVDPRPMTSDSAPALVHLENISVDGRQIDLKREVRVPAPHQRITLSYIALSLAVPARVKYKYRLEGFDPVWSEPVSAREAVYTNLSPGPYRFRVLASNSDGLWNSSELSIPFTILPVFWQTWWFLASCIACALACLYMLYLARLKQVTRQMQGRMEERLHERERIARELHDTMLQSFQGALLFFQAAVEQLPDSPDVAKPKEKLEIAIDHAQQAVTEGRDAVQGLRSSAIATNDIAAVLSNLSKDLTASEANQNPPASDVLLQGEPKNLDPVLRDEVCRIAGEALRNAFRHAHAKRIEVEIYYGTEQFRVRIRDDGKGLDPKVVADKGRPGHYGMRGMHERAKLVGGYLEVRSKPDSGTEIELAIPASTAYTTAKIQPRSWFTRTGTAVKSKAQVRR